jgi:hypothetical protein
MIKTGNKETKIRVINTINNFIDIQYVNPIELELKLEDIENKDQYILLANKLQQVPFIYESINKNLSLTILLRNILYNPAIYPIIISKKECTTNNCLYSKTPIKKNILTTNFTKLSIPIEDSLYVIGLAIDINKQSSLLNNNIPNSLYIVPEYLDYFETKHEYKLIYFDENIKEILLSIIKQLRYTIRFYDLSIFLLHIFNNNRIINNMNITNINKNNINIKSWYTKNEINHIKYLLNDQRNWIYNLDPLYLLNNDIYQLLYIITDGPNSDNIKDFFITKEINNSKNKKLYEVSKKTSNIINIARRYIIIIGKKFGNKFQQDILISLSKSKHLRLPGGSMAIPSISVNINNPNVILNYLSQDQQKLVKLEYEKQEKYIKLYKFNKCPHIIVYNKLIKTKNIKNVELFLSELKTYFNDSIIDGFYICKICDFKILCSHSFEKYNYQINNIPIGIINTNLYKYAIKIKINKNHEYYCKYCGEQLIRDIVIDDEYNIRTKSVISESQLELRNYIWSIILSIIKTAGLINERSLINHIFTTVKPLIDEKININDFDNKSKLICIMYVISYILLLIKDQKISVLNIDTNLSPSKIVEKLLNFIYVKYNSLMKNLYINTDILKNEFILAYKHITQSIINISSNVPVDNVESNLSNFILYIDPIYKYAKNICKLFKKIPNITNYNPQQLKKEFEMILGTSLPSIIKSAKENIKNPLFSDIINKRFGSVLQIESLEFFYKNPQLNIYNNLISIDNEDQILNQFLNQRYEYYVYACYIMFCKYVKNIHNIIEYNEYRKLFNKFTSIELNMLYELRKLSKKPLYTFNFINNSHFIKQTIYVTQLYDENGNKHIWAKYHYNDNNIYTNSNLPESKGKLIDVECIKCGIKKSEISKLNIEKTEQAIKSISDINSFYIFYKLRCPEGDLHNWINDKCNKCNITNTMIDNVTINNINKEILNYYNKYYKLFIKERKNISMLTSNENNDESNISSLIIPAWNEDYTIVVKISQLLNININIIESIGLTEFRTYNEVIDGIKIPIIELYNIYSAYAELLFAISKYNNYTNSTTPFYYTNIFNEMLYTASYEKIHKFIIQSICEIIFNLYEKNKDKSIELFNNILTNQKLLSIPTLNFTYIESDDNIIYLGDDIGDSGEDLITTQLTENNYYSSLNIDYDFKEDNPNNEPNIDIPNEYIYL